MNFTNPSPPPPPFNQTTTKTSKKKHTHNHTQNFTPNYLLSFQYPTVASHIIASFKICFLLLLPFLIF